MREYFRILLIKVMDIFGDKGICYRADGVSTGYTHDYIISRQSLKDYTHIDVCSRDDPEGSCY